MESTLQSAMHGATGSAAELVHRLAIMLYIGGGLIFVAVMLVLLHAVLRPAARVRPAYWTIGAGLAFPIVVLTALLIYSLAVGNALSQMEHRNAFRKTLMWLGDDGHENATAAPDVERVHVLGRQWWWEVRYEVDGETGPVVLANELHVPAGRPIEITLTSDDVIHSFWVPSLAGKVDLIPGRSNRLLMRADEPGVYRGQCAEYCGAQHALMAFFVVVESEHDYRDWLVRQAQPIVPPASDGAKLGFESFFKGGCDACHAIRGTAAVATIGPDLTHVGSRRSLAAGVLRNHVGTMAGWIANPQAVKPGNRMPATDTLTGSELRALSAWLGSLE